MTKNKPDDAPYKDEETLRYLYIEREKHISQIANIFGVDPATISHWMDKFGIEKRSRKETRSLIDLERVPSYTITSQGYPAWQTQHNNNRHQVLEHRLLAVARYGFDSLYGMQVHHSDGVRWNNTLENIELVDPSEHQHIHENWYAGGKSNVYTDEKLLSDIIEFYQKNGEWPRVVDFRSMDDCPAPRTYQDRFGGWLDAVSKAKDALDRNE